MPEPSPRKVRIFRTDTDAAHAREFMLQQPEILELIARISVMRPANRRSPRLTAEEFTKKLALAAASVMELVRWKALDQMRKEKQVTNDIIHLAGGLGNVVRTLEINGSEPIALDRSEFLVLLVLSLEMHRYWRGPIPLAPDDRNFLPAQQIVARIDHLRTKLRSIGELFRSATFADVHRVVNKLRHKIKKVKGNVNLIETGPRGSGYRLGTRQGNVFVRLFLVDGVDSDPGLAP